MKKLLHNITGWLVKKTNYTPELPLPIQPIIIKSENLKRFHAQRIVPYQEHLFYLYADIEKKMVHYNCDDAENREGEYIKAFRFDIANELLNEINIKKEEVPEGVMYSCNLLMKNI